MKDVSIAASHWSNMYSSPRAMTWHMNPHVFQHICLRMHGHNKHWLGWLFEDYLQHKPSRLLSVGCGDGSHELVIARNNYVDIVDAFDISELGIEIAAKTAQKEGLSANFYIDSFESFANSEVTEKYDVIMFIGSLHHASNLEAVLLKTKMLLNPGGVVVINEHVGPCYIVLPEDRIKIINSILSSLPDKYKITPDALWRNPTYDEILKTDPSESIRSSIIPQMTELFFKIEFTSNYGGGILHPIFQLLDSNILSDGSIESEAIVKLLIQLENLLETNNILPSDFIFRVMK